MDEATEALTNVPDAVLDRWLLPLDRLVQYPLGELLPSKDGYFYHLPPDFQFPLACRDPTTDIRYRHFAQRQMVGYVQTALPLLVLPPHPHASVHVDRAALRVRMRGECEPYDEAVAKNAERLDVMTATRDGLRYLAALILSGKEPARLAGARSLFGNAIAQTVAPGMEWVPFVEPS